MAYREKTEPEEKLKPGRGGETRFQRTCVLGGKPRHLGHNDKRVVGRKNRNVPLGLATGRSLMT